MSLVAVTTFFNPMGWRSRVHNFSIFLKRIKRQGVPVCVVECKRPDEAWNVSREQVDFCFRYEAPDVMWQKERLFNLGVKRLPPECKVVALLDADILFENPNWAKESEDLILNKGFRVVQPFEAAEHLPKNSLIFTKPGVFWRKGFAKVFQETGKSSLRPHFESFGHPGFGIVYDRALIEEVGLYEKMIFGGGDTINALATCGDSNSEKWWYSDGAVKGVAEYTEDLWKWRNSWRAQLPVDKLVGYVPQRVFHLWHGKKEDRRYWDRRAFYGEQKITPDQILSLPEKPLCFSPDVSQECRDRVLRYFAWRKEDN